jgi:cyclic-di-AMP phosphodiesterase PgpH
MQTKWEQQRKMPDSKGNSDNQRFDRLTKSVLESNHPVFGKVKKELPQLQQRARAFRTSLLERVWHLAQAKNLPMLGFVLSISFLLSFFIYRNITDPAMDYQLGEVAQRHLVSPRTIEMVDEETTEAKRQSAAESILAVYDYDRMVAANVRAKVSQAFQTLRKQHQAVVNISERRRLSPGDLEKTDAFREAKKSFEKITELGLSDHQFEALVRLKYSPRLERTFLHLLSETHVNLIVPNREMLKADAERGISLNRIDANRDRKSEITFQNISAVLDVESARADLESRLTRFLEQPANDSLIPYNDRISAIAKMLVGPNLTLNRQETENRRRAVVTEVKPVLVKISKGEPLVRYGETVSKRHLAILKQMKELTHKDSTRLLFFFTALFLSILIYSVISFLDGGVPATKVTNWDIVSLALLMVGGILLLKGVQFVATEALIEKFPQVPFEFYFYLVPLAAGPFMVRMLMGKQVALIFTLVLSVVGGILLERNFFYSAFILASSFFACSWASGVRTRGAIYRAGMGVGIVNMILLVCIAVHGRNAGSISMLWGDLEWVFWASVLSGVFTAMTIVSMVPVIEWISGRTSDLRLLELANMNHPLLRDLMVKAPGTYHHSIVIGSLVEAGAEAIGANPLLARVMAYYHDVGKMERPLYFIENQAGGYNRHDSLQPHMSAMIIRDHVKAGQELGRKHKLPKPLIDAMSEHHGSSTIWYFFNKAKSQAEDPESVLESDYKYDGQGPQSKETALVMLGDVVEAATRSVADPTPMRLTGVVKNILNKYFAEGQLSSCDLTLRDLDAIASSFIDVLLGIYHARIEYGVAQIRETGKKRSGPSGDQKPPARTLGSGALAAAQSVGSPSEAQVSVKKEES